MTWLTLVALAVSFVWEHEGRLVGEDTSWLQLGLAVAALAYLGYGHLQHAWWHGRVGKRDGMAALAALSIFALGLGIAITASTDQARFDAPRSYTNLFTLLILAGASAAGDAVGCQERYRRAQSGDLLLEEVAPGA